MLTLRGCVVIVKPLLIAAGFVSLGLGALGVVLPLLPTVPFVLLAAFCFARSSDRFHQKLLQNRLFGPMIHHWQTTRSMPRRSKYVAIASIVASGGLSIYLITEPLFQVAVVVLLSVPLAIVLRLPVTEKLVAVKE